MHNKKEILQSITHGILVSCQAYDQNPHATVEAMVTMALAGKMGGCVGFRANSPEYVKAIRDAVGNDLVIIGIWKIFVEGNDVYITTTMDAVSQLVTAGSNIVAIDCTDRVNAYGYKGLTLVPQIKIEFPELVIMADCSNIDEAKAAAKAGVDIIASTLSGYTSYTADKYEKGIDLELLSDMSKISDIHILAEGRIWTREEAIKAFKAGAHTCVIGTAITNPWQITKRFVDAKDEFFK